MTLPFSTVPSLSLIVSAKATALVNNTTARQMTKWRNGFLTITHTSYAKAWPRWIRGYPLTVLQGVDGSRSLTQNRRVDSDPGKMAEAGMEKRPSGLRKEGEGVPPGAKIRLPPPKKIRKNSMKKS